VERLPAGPVGVVRDTDIRQAALADPALAEQLYRALGQVTATDPPQVTVYAMRVRAKVFGHNAARKPIYFTKNSIPQDPGLWIDWDASWNYEVRQTVAGPAVVLPEDERLVRLDRVYDGIQNGSITVVTRPDQQPLILDGVGATASTTNRAEYGLTGPCSVLDLGLDAAGQGRSWWPAAFEGPGTAAPSMAQLRTTVVHTAAEPLPLADEPVTDDVGGTLLELDGIYDGLAPGRLLALTGERHDLGIPGVRTTEIVRVGAVDHVAARTEDDVRAGERNHTLLTLDSPLAGTYLRASVDLAGNVVEATHGETKSEVLGSGDASIPRQRFTLRSSPLTHVSAATPTGAVPALELRVDDVLWPLRYTPVGLGPDDRGYLLRLAEDQTASVVGLDGSRGRRFPSGSENVRARYRVGIGRPGNVDANTITLLATKPLGVVAVTNPVPATGGADPESGDDIRRNVAVPLRALDRLVSVPDYADFARAFAGIGKASADRLVVRGREEIVVTVAGVDDAPIADDSALRRNLLAALRTFGDPLIGVRVLVRERLVMRLALTVTIYADRDWAVVSAQLRAGLAAAFSFDGRELGRSVAGSEVLVAAHRVPGVRRCVISGLTTEPPPPPPPTAPPVHPGPRLVVLPARADADGPHPAQLAYLAPELPEYLVLTPEGA
jgi:predicted phage baseplate assembly protein